MAILYFVISVFVAVGICVILNDEPEYGLVFVRHRLIPCVLESGAIVIIDCNSNYQIISLIYGYWK